MNASMAGPPPDIDEIAPRSAWINRWHAASIVMSRPRRKRLSASRATRRRSSSARQRLAQPRLAELGEEQRHIGIVERDGAADRQGAVERRFDEARRLGFVGEVEAGIDAGLEREFVQQRQAERVDGADADVVEARRGSPASARPARLPFAVALA